MTKTTIKFNKMLKSREEFRISIGQIRNTNKSVQKVDIFASLSVFWGSFPFSWEKNPNISYKTNDTFTEGYKKKKKRRK